MLSNALDDPRGTRTETTVLFLAANPVEIQLLQLGEECRAIEDKIRGARFRDKLRFRSRWAARPDDLLQTLHEDDPTVLHFSGHGVGAQGLCFLAEDGRALLVNSDGLGQVIRAAGDSIQLVVLNACYSRVQAEALVLHVPCVIGMPSTIGDKSAIVYAAELYRALAFGKSVASAHECGLAALALHSMAGCPRDIDVAEAALRGAPPELLVRTGIDAGSIRIVRGAPSTDGGSASSGESRIHLEIDIDADFETLDANTLGKLVSEVRRLSGGRPVRILCVTKGSIRLRLSFEPEAARTLIDLRDSGRLKRIGGFRVSNLVDRGQVEISAQALEHADAQLASDPAIEVVRRPARVARSPRIRTAGDVSGKATTLPGVWVAVPGQGALPDLHASPIATSQPALRASLTTLHTVLADAAPVLTRIAQRLYGNTQDANDLLQDTIERAIRQGLPADVQNSRAWLATIMHNLFVDRSRAAARAPVHEPLEDVHDNVTPLSVDSPEPAWSHLTIEDVRAALEVIDRPFREVYVMHTFERRSFEDIAAQLKISRVTVGTRLTRTRKMLRKELVKRFGRGKKP